MQTASAERCVFFYKIIYGFSGLILLFGCIKTSPHLFIEPADHSRKSRMTDYEKSSEGENQHRLSCLENLPPSLENRLQSLWITTVEQLVAMCATEKGRKGVESLEECGELLLIEILVEAKSLLGEALYSRLMTPEAGGALGARFASPNDEHFFFRSDAGDCPK